MDEKKLKNDKLLDIPDFLRRLDENRSENAPEVAAAPPDNPEVEDVVIVTPVMSPSPIKFTK